MDRYYGDQRLSGDRIVEVSWVREQVKFLRSSPTNVADFCSVIRPATGTCLGWSSYFNQDYYNVFAFDCEPCPGEIDMFYVVDLMKPQKLPGAPFDVGVCISAIEHFGLCAYGDKAPVENGDQKGLRVMWDNIGKGGYLLVTVPCGRGKILNGWIREYAPDDVVKLVDTLPNVMDVEIDHFFARQNHAGRYNQWYRVTADELVNLKSNEPDDFTITTGLACISIQKDIR